MNDGVGMKKQRFTEQFAVIFDLALELASAAEVDALLVFLDGPTDWEQLTRRAPETKILVAADEQNDRCKVAT